MEFNYLKHGRLISSCWEISDFTLGPDEPVSALVERLVGLPEYEHLISDLREFEADWLAAHPVVSGVAERKQSSTEAKRQEILERLANGESKSSIAKSMGVLRSTVQYHAKKLETW